MKNILAIAILAVFVTGCASQPVKLRTETQDVFKPILYCPAPQEVEQPELVIFSISPEDKDGEVVKKYKATIRQLQDYTKQLEEQLNKYDETNQAYEELRQEFINKKEQDGFTNESN